MQVVGQADNKTVQYVKPIITLSYHLAKRNPALTGVVTKDGMDGSDGG